MPPPDDQRESSDWGVSLREAGPYLGLGMQLAFTIIAFTLGGYFLDRQFDTLPWLTIVGAIVGLVLLFAQLYRTATEIARGGRKASGRRS